MSEEQTLDDLFEQFNLPTSNYDLKSPQHLFPPPIATLSPERKLSSPSPYRETTSLPNLDNTQSLRTGSFSALTGHEPSLDIIDVPSSAEEESKIEDIVKEKVQAPYAEKLKIVDLLGLLAELKRINPANPFFLQQTFQVIKNDDASKLLREHEGEFIWPQPVIDETTVFKYEGKTQKGEDFWSFEAKSPYFSSPLTFATKKLKQVAFADKAYWLDMNEMRVKVVREIDVNGKKLQFIIDEPTFIHTGFIPAGPFILPPQQSVSASKPQPPKRQTKKASTKKDEDEDSDDDFEYSEEDSSEESDESDDEDSFDDSSPVKKKRKQSANKIKKVPKPNKRQPKTTAPISKKNVKTEIDRNALQFIRDFLQPGKTKKLPFVKATLQTSTNPAVILTSSMLANMQPTAAVSTTATSNTSAEVNLESVLQQRTDAQLDNIMQRFGYNNFQKMSRQQKINAIIQTKPQ